MIISSFDYVGFCIELEKALLVMIITTVDSFYEVNDTDLGSAN